MLHVFILYTKCIEMESYRRSVRSRSEIPPLRDYCGMMCGAAQVNTAGGAGLPGVGGSHQAQEEAHNNPPRV